MKKKALVTGGCGFVGRRYVKQLIERGYHVTIVDDLSTGLPPRAWRAPSALSDRQARHMTFHQCDFREYAREASPEFDLIVHLAAVVGGRMTIEGDPLAVATDLAIDATFFNWVVRSPRPEQVLYFSSSAAYPIHLQTPENHRPLSEDMIVFDENMGVPDMTYGWSKLTGEFLARFAARDYDLNVITFRPFSGYGEDQAFTYPFPSVIRRVARKESPIVVWGSGRQMRDFIHIDDVVEATFAAAERLQPGDVINLGSGVGTTFVELAKLASDVLGHDAEIVNDSSKPEGVFARVGDCRRMLELYEPKISLSEGIERVYRYQAALPLNTNRHATNGTGDQDVKARPVRASVEARSGTNGVEAMAKKPSS
ncbi:MAG: NAD-dependent epimerase/dehydratase family protein [Rhodothermales bacterium]